MAKLYKVDGSVVNIEPQDAKKGFTLEECYKHIVCTCIDARRFRDGWIVFDDEGRLTGEPLNVPFMEEFGIVLVGNVILCDVNEFK